MTTNKIIYNSIVPGHEGPCRQIDFCWSTQFQQYLAVFRSVGRRWYWPFWRQYGERFFGVAMPADSLPHGYPMVLAAVPLRVHPKVNIPPSVSSRVTSGSHSPRKSGLARQPLFADTKPSSSITEEGDPYPYRSSPTEGTTTGRTPSEYTPPFHSGRGGDYAGAGATGSWEDAPKPTSVTRATLGGLPFAGLPESVFTRPEDDICRAPAPYIAPETMPPAPAPDEACRASDYSSPPPPAADPPSDPPAASPPSSDSGGSSGSGD